MNQYYIESQITQNILSFIYYCEYYKYNDSAFNLFPNLSFYIISLILSIYYRLE